MIVDDDGVTTIIFSSLPEVEIERPTTLVLRNVDMRYNGTYRFQVITIDSDFKSDVVVFIAGK